MGDASGAIVTELRDKLSPAGRAGLQVGDIIVEFGGKKIKDAGDLITRVSSASPDETIGLVYLREAGTTLDRRSTEIKLAERLIETRANLPESERRKLGPESPRVNNSFGLTLSDLTPTLASSYKLEGQRGVVVKEVNPESYIADVKISNGSEAFSEGDLIRRINRVAVTDMKTFNAAVAKLKPGDAVVMEVISYSPSGRAPQLKIVQFTVQ
jgi:serine protease Do